MKNPLKPFEIGLHTEKIFIVSGCVTGKKSKIWSLVGVIKTYMQFPSALYQNELNCIFCFFVTPKFVFY